MIKKSYVLIDSDDKCRQAVDYLTKYSYIAFDTETTGLKHYKDKVIGMSFSGEKGKAFYISRLSWDKDQSELVQKVSDYQFINILKIIKNKELLTWNGSFDTNMVYSNFGIDIKDSMFFDGHLAKHTLNEEAKLALKTTMVELKDILGDVELEGAINQEQIDLKENVKSNGGSTTKDNYEMYKADLEVMYKYACMDADFTLRICEYLRDKLEEENLDTFFFDTEVMPLYKNVTVIMERKGVMLNLPLIQSALEEIKEVINKYEIEIIESLISTDAGKKWLQDTSIKNSPPKKTGSFAQKLCEELHLPLPKGDSGKYSLTQKSISKLPESKIKDFLSTGDESLLERNIVNNICQKLWIEKNIKPINISSKSQLGDLVFNYMNISSISKTKKDADQFNDSFIQHLVEEYKFDWAVKLSDYNKLVKIQGAYLERFLYNHHDGKYYFYYKQAGTISGRYSSDAQQLPRPKEEGELSPTVLYFTNMIRGFFVSEDNRIFIDSDYESLEPHVFSHVADDDGLMEIFRKGYDFYSTIAIKTEKLEGVSADKKAENYLGKVNKPLRQKAKAYSLGVPYGMSSYALGKTLGVSTEEAEALMNGYLDGFPNLKEWMHRSKKDAQLKGFVSTEAGRVRHLQRVKDIHRAHGEKVLDFKYKAALESRLGKDEALAIYLDYKNGINNARNFQIQGLSASIVNQSMIKIMQEFEAKGIDAWVCATIHDQIIVNAPEDKKEECAEIVTRCMTQTIKLKVDLKAPPAFSHNWKDGH